MTARMAKDLQLRMVQFLCAVCSCKCSTETFHIQTENCVRQLAWIGEKDQHKAIARSVLFGKISNFINKIKIIKKKIWEKSV